MGKETEPCARHEKSSCWHHDCGHYIPLDGRLLCCEPGQMLEKEPLVPWIRAIEHVSKVRYVLSTNGTIATTMLLRGYGERVLSYSLLLLCREG